MRPGPLRGDLSILRQGLSLSLAFGLGSLEELARVAWQIEHDVYRRGDLRRVDGGVRVELRNPPMRLGAFRTVAVSWDRLPLPVDAVRVATGRRPALRSAAGISVDDPLTLDVGEGSTYELALPSPPSPGPHRVRIEWRSVAIPPPIWIEFSDDLRGAV